MILTTGAVIKNIFDKIWKIEVVTAKNKTKPNKNLLSIDKDEFFNVSKFCFSLKIINY